MKLDEKAKKKDVQGLIIKEYQQYLKLGRPLSKNTLDVYLMDLDKLLNSLSDEGVDILEISLKDLQRFAAGLHDIGIYARSQVHVISGIKSFFYFLIAADYIEADPSELPEGPKIDLKLPGVLTVEGIDHVIPTVDLSRSGGWRDQAVSETLYSCGLQALKLTNLRPSGLYFNRGFVKVEGKGSKQRLVPIFPRAIQEIRYYFANRNRINIKKDYEDYLLSSRWRTHLSCIMIFHPIKELTDMVGITKNINPHTFWHSSVARLLERSVNLRTIQCMLGHESISTIEICIYIGRNMLRSEVTEYHPRNTKHR